MTAPHQDPIAADNASIIEETRQQLASLRGRNDFMADLERQGLQSMLYEITGEHPLGTVLEIHLQSNDDEHSAPAAQAASMLDAWQDAVALLGAAFTASDSDLADPQRVTLQRRERHELRVLAPAPGSLLLTLLVPGSADPGEPMQQSLVPGTREAREAERALVDLVQALPDSGETFDESAEAAIAAARPALQQGLGAIAKSVREHHTHMDLTLRRPREQVSHAHLEPAYAAGMMGVLDETVTESSIERREGRLDGMRTRKRKFWLILDDDTEISGGVPDDLLEVVRNNLDERVSVDLEVSRTRRPGHEGRSRYILRNLGRSR